MFFQTPSVSPLPTAHIFLKRPSSKPLIADLQVVENWCPANYKAVGPNGRNIISGRFFKSKLPEDLRGSTEVELIWRKDNSSDYWIGKFQVDYCQHTDIKLGSYATPYNPKTPNIDEEIEIDAPPTTETNAQVVDAHALPQNDHISPVIYIALAIIVLVWAHPGTAVNVTAIIVLGTLGAFVHSCTS